MDEVDIVQASLIPRGMTDDFGRIVTSDQG